MMSNEIARQPNWMTPELAEAVYVKKDCRSLTAAQRLQYIAWLCEQWDVNPGATPFIWIATPDGKLNPYPTKGFAEQVRVKNKISIKLDNTTVKDGMVVVEVTASDRSGRSEPEIGAASYGNSPQQRVNARMKAMTVAKRRAALAMSGCGMNAEEEMMQIPGAKRVVVNPETGEIVNEPRVSAEEVANAIVGSDDEEEDEPPGKNEYICRLSDAADKGIEFLESYGRTLNGTLDHLSQDEQEEIREEYKRLHNELLFAKSTT